MKRNKIILLMCLFGSTVLMAQNNEQNNNDLNEELALVAVPEVSEASSDLIASNSSNTSVNSLGIDSNTTSVSDVSLNVDSAKNEITIKKGWYYLNDKKLKNNELKELLKNDPASAAEYKKSRSASGWGTFTEIIVIVGVSVATQLSPGGILVGTVAGIVAAIPFSIHSGKHLKEAIKQYNLKHA